MSGKHTKGGVSQASLYWVWAIIGAVAYEVTMLAMGHRGGALSHVVWWANSLDTGLYGLRWVLVTGPLFGFLGWLVPHFGWGWGGGMHLLLFVLAATLILAAVSLIA